MSHLYFVLLWYDGSINIDGNLDRWHFDWNLNSLLYFNGAIYIHRFINVNWFFHNSGNLNSFDNLFRLIWGLDRNFLFDLYIFWDFHYFLYNAFRTRNMLRDFYLYFHWFLNHNLFNNLLRNVRIYFFYFSLFLLNQPF